MYCVDLNTESRPASPATTHMHTLITYPKQPHMTALATLLTTTELLTSPPYHAIMDLMHATRACRFINHLLRSFIMATPDKQNVERANSCFEIANASATAILNQLGDFSTLATQTPLNDKTHEDMQLAISDAIYEALKPLYTE